MTVDKVPSDRPGQHALMHNEISLHALVIPDDLQGKEVKEGMATQLTPVGRHCRGAMFSICSGTRGEAGNREFGWGNADASILGPWIDGFGGTLAEVAHGGDDELVF